MSTPRSFGCSSLIKQMLEFSTPRILTLLYRLLKIPCGILSPPIKVRFLLLAPEKVVPINPNATDVSNGDMLLRIALLRNQFLLLNPMEHCRSCSLFLEGGIWHFLGFVQLQRRLGAAKLRLYFGLRCHAPHFQRACTFC